MTAEYEFCIYFFSYRYNIEWFEKMSIVASNDINEEILHSLNFQVI
jgi:hypothetical protein